MGVADVDIPGSFTQRRDCDDVNCDIAIRAQQQRNEARSSLFDALVILEQLQLRHVPDETPFGGRLTGKACAGCGATYPCKDRRILDGDLT